MFKWRTSELIGLKRVKVKVTSFKGGSISAPRVGACAEFGTCDD
jgi:hypothetical protein